MVIYVKIGNLKQKNRDHKKVLKQDEGAGDLQILLHLISPFDCCCLTEINLMWSSVANATICSRNMDLKCKEN